MTVNTWLSALEARHFADLQFAEVTRALRALSSTYVERRERLTTRSAFDSAGKRAAYALYYGPLHFLTVRSILEAIGPACHPPRTILDLGCGTGAAGAAWATSIEPPAAVIGVDSHPWAREEAAFTYRTWALEATLKRGHVAQTPISHTFDAVVAAWVVNELDAASRAALLETLIQAARAGTAILIVEPIATRVAPWWADWVARFAPLGARADQWRVPVVLPELLKKLDRAAGMRHDEVTARSIYAGDQRSGILGTRD